MIIANQLRIGNWVLTEQGYYQVTGFDIYKSDENDDNGLQPIPLSEEILIKCGFSKMADKHYTQRIGNFIFGIGYIDGGGWCYKYYGTDQLSDFFNSLHELQNLVKSICRKELEI